MSVVTTAGPTHWVSARWACARLGIGLASLRRLVEMREVGVRSLPGLPPRYAGEDVERLVAEGTRPALRGAPDQD